MKFIISLLVLCLAISVGCSLAKTGSENIGSTDNTAGMMSNVTGNTCSVSGIVALEPVNMTGTGNVTGGNQTGNMTGMSNMTGIQMYDINATASCVPEAMNNMTGAKKCYITGTATSISVDITGNQTENMTGNQTENMTGSQEGGNITIGKTYNITATILCTPKAMNNMTGGNQTGNMTGMDNMTGAQMYDITGNVTLTPANITGAQAGNMTGNQTGSTTGSQAGRNITVGQTYSVTATVLCVPEAMNNMTGGNQTGNMTGNQTGSTTGGQAGGNMTGMGNMTGVQLCNISGTATAAPANMTGTQTYYIDSTVECMPGAMTNMTGTQAGNKTRV